MRHLLVIACIIVCGCQTTVYDDAGRPEKIISWPASGNETTVLIGNRGNYPVRIFSLVPDEYGVYKYLRETEFIVWPAQSVGRTPVSRRIEIMGYVSSSYSSSAHSVILCAYAFNPETGTIYNEEVSRKVVRVAQGRRTVVEWDIVPRLRTLPPEFLTPSNQLHRPVPDQQLQPEMYRQGNKSYSPREELTPRRYGEPEGSRSEVTVPNREQYAQQYLETSKPATLHDRTVTTSKHVRNNPDVSHDRDLVPSGGKHSPYQAPAGVKPGSRIRSEDLLPRRSERTQRNSFQTSDPPRWKDVMPGALPGTTYRQTEDRSTDGWKDVMPGALPGTTYRQTEDWAEQNRKENCEPTTKPATQSTVPETDTWNDGKLGQPNPYGWFRSWLNGE